MLSSGKRLENNRELAFSLLLALDPNPSITPSTAFYNCFNNWPRGKKKQPPELAQPEKKPELQEKSLKPKEQLTEAQTHTRSWEIA